ncbi:MAG: cytochrome c oxidase assembly protein [Rhodobacteraceae bacterium]|nr:cytochrome c oxidase assembly protein [Paracoccaceae bacterium]
MSLIEKNRRVMTALVAVVAIAGGASWASIPLYDWFCRVTGYGGETARAEASASDILDRRIKIRFDASIERGMPWDFRPLEREIEVRIGETSLAYSEAVHPADVAVAGPATFNVYPFTAGNYFVKVDCFCFEHQVLQPGERVIMPVSFYVDPDIVNDQEAASASVITLSYTYHQTAVTADSHTTPQPTLQDSNLRDI